MPDDIAVQAAVVLQLLGRAGAYPRTDLFAAVDGVTIERVTAALDSLTTAGVIQFGAGGVRVTEPVRHLDTLGLIAV